MPRKVKHEEHENLERWLVSYADFITLLFAFFVVMYAISSLNEGKYRVLSESLVNAFRNTPASADPLTPFRTSQSPSANAVIKTPVPARKADMVDPRIKQQQGAMKDVAKNIVEVMAPLVKEGQVRVTQTTRGVIIEISASVLFASGSATLEKESIRVLSAVGQVLAGSAFPVQVEGHTDTTPINTVVFPSNWELSAARASSVVRLFIDYGVKADRLVAVGYGEQHPVERNDTVEGRARNRRVTVMILAEEDRKITDIPIAGSPYNPDAVKKQP